MAVVNCILDPAVHRTIKLGLTFTIPGTFPKFTIVADTSAAYPSGHRIDIIFQNGGNAVSLPFAGIKKPQDRDAQICVAAPCPGTSQTKAMALDDGTYRVYVLGKELSTTPGVSFIVVSQINIINGTTGDILLYTDTNGNNLAMTAGPDDKIPPNLG